MRQSRWPLRLSVREGVATARTGRWTSLLVIVAVSLAVATGAADAVGVSRLVDEERAWVAAGGHVLVVTGSASAEERAAVPAARCEQLTSLDGVEAAFALRHATSTAALAHTPGGRVSLYEVSPGVMQFLGLEPALEGVIVASATFAERSAVRDGETSRLLLEGRDDVGPVVVRTADTTPLGDHLDGALLAPTLLTGAADLCFVRADAARHGSVRAALPALLAADGAPAAIDERLAERRFTADLAQRFEDRPLRWLWVACAVLLGLLWAMLQWSRRSHTAIYSTFGMPTASRLVMQVTEWGVLAGLGGLVGAGTGTVWALALGAAPGQTVVTVTLHATLTLLAATVLVTLLGLRPAGDLLATLKDR